MRKRDRGVYEIRVYLGRDTATGKKQYRSHTVRGTQREADQMCRVMVAEAEAAAVAATSVSGPAGSETVGDWLDIWWEAKKPSLSPTTVSSWKSSIELYLKPARIDGPLRCSCPSSRGDLPRPGRRRSVTGACRRCTRWRRLRSGRRCVGS